jgi:hypothetical protein
MLGLQSCTDSLRVLPGSSIETLPSSSDGTYDVGSMKVEEDVDVREVCFVAINEEVDKGIKQEEIPEDITSRDIKSGPDEVSCVCICLLLDTFYQYPKMSFFLVMSVFLADLNSSTVGNENV